MVKFNRYSPILSTSSSTMTSNKCKLSQQQYHDYANVIEEDLKEVVDRKPYSSNSPAKKVRRGPRGGVTTPFPSKLHQLLEDERYPEIISWQSHGRCFTLRKPHDFLAKVMTKYFKQTKLTSFQRQLNLYAFRRISSGPDKGAYYHELFLRGKPALCSHMVRMRVKGTKIKSASCPETEPNFYDMPPLKASSSYDAEAVSEDDTVSSQPLPSEPLRARSSSMATESLISDTCDSSISVSSSSENMTFQKPSTVITNSFNFNVPRRSSIVPTPALSAPQKQSFQHQTPYIDVSPPEPEPAASPVLFEGKGFYYIDSLDHWDACTLPLAGNDKQSPPNLMGLSINPNSGELCGFEI
jgi:hypothetical protein